MTKDEMKNRISMTLKDPILQQGFEIICKNLAELEKENAELNKKLSKAEADRPKWHKVADGDLPKTEDLEMQVLCFTYDGYQLLSLFSDPKPIFKGYGVIAWCEIPKYTEE